MTPEKWQNIISKVKDDFKIEESSKYHLDEEGGTDIEFIVFQGPLGKMKLEFISKPVVLDKKTTYSNRIGSLTKVDYIYSQNEKNHKLRIYKWDDLQNEWLEIDNKNFNL